LKHQAAEQTEIPDAFGEVLKFLACTQRQRRLVVQREIEFAAFDGPREGSPRFTVDLEGMLSGSSKERSRVRKWIDARQDEGWNLAYVVNPHGSKGTARGVTSNHVFAVLGFTLDLELRNATDAERQKCARVIRDKGPLPPTLVIDSGRGLHVYWILKRPCWRKKSSEVRGQLFAEHQRRVQAFRWRRLLREHVRSDLMVKVDRSVIDLSRLMRLPGTLNLRPSSPRRCQVLVNTDLRCKLVEIPFAFPPPHSRSRSKEQEGEPAAATDRKKSVVKAHGDRRDGRPPARIRSLYSRLRESSCRPRFTDDGKIAACCPIHDDAKPSLVASALEDGSIGIYCHACGKGVFEEIAAALGLSSSWFAPGYEHPNAIVIRLQGSLQQYIQGVGKIPDLSRSDKFVLVYLASRVNLRKTGKIFSSLRSIAKGCGCSQRAIQESLRRLKQRKLITWRRGNSHGVSNDYFLCPLANLVPSVSSTPVEPSDQARVEGSLSLNAS